MGYCEVSGAFSGIARTRCSGFGWNARLDTLVFHSRAVGQGHWRNALECRGGGDDLRLLLCGCGQVPESRVESVADCWSGEMGAEGGRPLVRLLMDGR